MVFGEAVDDVGEIGFGIEAIEDCRLQDGIEDSGAVAAGLRAEEEEDGMTVLRQASRLLYSRWPAFAFDAETGGQVDERVQRLYRSGCAQRDDLGSGC